MSKSNTNAHVYADTDYAVWTAPFGTAMPVNLPPNNPAGFFEVGLLSDNGITEGHTFNETQIYDMAGSLIRIARSQEQRPFTFEALESNAVSFGLMYPGSAVTTTGATAEVQTVTITGAPTGGTFNLTLPGYGTAAASVYNITTTLLATALNAAFGVTGITVTGTAGTSYVVTFPSSLGNVAQMTASAAFTGGTTPTIAVATTTPGVTGTNSRPVSSGIGRNLRAFVLDLSDGILQRRILINSGEAEQNGTVTYSATGMAIYQFTLNPYKDTSGNYFTILDNDTAQAGAFA